MNKTLIKYIIDVGLAISFLTVLITGILKYPGLTSSLGTNVKNLPFHTITTLHDRSGILMAAFVLAHLILNWNWIICITKQFFKKEKTKCEKQ